MKKLLFLYNPHTASGKLRSHLYDIIDVFTQNGYEVTAHPTSGPGEAAQRAKKAKGYEMLVCCGGDGTLNEVVEGLMSLEKPPLLGYLPAGTTNDFASSLGIPKSNIMDAVDRAMHPKEIFQYDVGSFNERYFNYVAAFGAFTDVSYTTPQKSKNLMGYFAYLVEAISKLSTIHSFRANIETPDAEIGGEFILGMVSNSASVGGFSYVDKKDVSLNDGIFEVLLVRPPQNLSDLGALSGALMTKNTASPLIETLCVKNIKIVGEQPITWTLDGEFGGEVEEASIHVHERALRICI